MEQTNFDTEELTEISEALPTEVETKSNEELIWDLVMKIVRGESKLSFSALSAFKQSPRAFVEYKLKLREQTPAMLYGSMVHCLVLEPSKFEERYLVLDDTQICAEIGGAKPRATTKYKDWMKIFTGAKGDKELVSSDDFKAAKKIAHDVRNNPAASRIMELCTEFEQKIEWTFENFQWRGIIDGRSPLDLAGRRVRFDLKTMADASPRKVQRDIFNNDIHVQAACYAIGDGDEDLRDQFFIIAVDKEGGISCHELTRETLVKGAEDYLLYTQKFSECVLRKDFDRSFDYYSERADGIFTVNKPAWIL